MRKLVILFLLCPTLLFAQGEKEKELIEESEIYLYALDKAIVVGLQPRVGKYKIDQINYGNMLIKENNFTKGLPNKMGKFEKIEYMQAHDVCMMMKEMKNHEERYVLELNKIQTDEDNYIEVEIINTIVTYRKHTCEWSSEAHGYHITFEKDEASGKWFFLEDNSEQ